MGCGTWTSALASSSWNFSPLVLGGLTPARARASGIEFSKRTDWNRSLRAERIDASSSITKEHHLGWRLRHG